MKTTTNKQKLTDKRTNKQRERGKKEKGQSIKEISNKYKGGGRKMKYKKKRNKNKNNKDYSWKIKENQNKNENTAKQNKQTNTKQGKQNRKPRQTKTNQEETENKPRRAEKDKQVQSTLKTNMQSRFPSAPAAPSCTLKEPASGCASCCSPSGRLRFPLLPAWPLVVR